jgi:hypothetical protein
MTPETSPKCGNQRRKRSLRVFLRYRQSRIFLSGDTFTQFDVPDALSTFVLALNDAGNFAGDFDPPAGAPGVCQYRRSITSFWRVPGATINSAFSINNSNEASGDYLDSGSVTHGYFRDSAGTLTFPLGFSISVIRDQNHWERRQKRVSESRESLSLFPASSRSSPPPVAKRGCPDG